MKKKKGVRGFNKGGWAVIWLNDGGVGAARGSMLVVAPVMGWDNKPLKNKKGIQINSLAIFQTKYEAELFRDKNEDWGTIRICLLHA